jgi:hypothetical protein
MHNQLLTILRDCWQFSTGLNKFLFQWNKTPANLTVLAATDNSGIVKFHGIKYHVQYQHDTDLIDITRA